MSGRPTLLEEAADSGAETMRAAKRGAMVAAIAGLPIGFALTTTGQAQGAERGDGGVSEWRISELDRADARVRRGLNSGVVVRGAEAVVDRREPRALKLASGVVNTAERRGAASLSEAISAWRRGESSDHRRVVQLDGPMTSARREALRAAGVRVLGYVPDDAYVVSLRSADAEAVKSLSFVRWHGGYERSWSRSPDLAARRTYTSPARQAFEASGRVLLSATLFADADADAFVGELLREVPRAAVHGVDGPVGGATVFLSVERDRVGSVLSLADVQWLEPTPELTQRNASTRWLVQSEVPGATPVYANGITGTGQVVGIVDGPVNIDHCSFDDDVPPGPGHRKVLAYNNSLSSDIHGTHVAATAAGAPSSAGDFTDRRGVAYDALLVLNTVPSFTEAGIFNTLSLHHNQGARVHGNSWGDDRTTQYNGLTRGIDRFMHENEDSLVLFAVTNQASLRNPENAKNLLAVGASQDAGAIGSHCSGGVGPTADGRRKPEIYAPGCSTVSASASTSCGVRALTGTSMACPAVTGAAALVRQYYEDGFYPSGVASVSDSFVPTGALVKATLLASTVDMEGVAGYPSNLEGWGLLKLDNALFFEGDESTLTVTDIRNADGLETGDVYEQNVTLTGVGGGVLGVTVCWTDPPALAGTFSPAVNDLDLQLISPGGVTYLGNVFAGGVSVAGGSADGLNNVERVILPNAEAGVWTVRVVGSAVTSGPQGFAMAATGDLLSAGAPVSLSLDSGPLESVEPDVASDVTVTATAKDGELVPGSVRLHWSIDGGVTYASSAMTTSDGVVFDGVLPAFSCGDDPAWYVSAESVTLGEVTLPAALEASPFRLEVGLWFELMMDNFESDGGWSVNAEGLDTASRGVWERAVPQRTVNSSGVTAQPGEDYSAEGDVCWVTDADPGTQFGNFDVDDGATRLYSPVMDLTPYEDPRVSYWRWYTNSSGNAPFADVFEVDISSNGGRTWVPVERVGPSGSEVSGGWFQHEFRVLDFVGLGTEVQLRFTASDVDAGSIVEAAIDDVHVYDFVCDLSPICPGDANGDGRTTLDDFSSLAVNFGSSTDLGRSAGDLDRNGVVDLDDFSILAADFGCSVAD